MVWVLLAVSAASLTAQDSPRPAWTTSRLTVAPEPPSPYALEPVFGTLKFKLPVDLCYQADAKRWFLLEQSGKLWSFPNDRDVAEADLVFDPKPHQVPNQNAYAVAFHPGYATNRLLYMNYNLGHGITNGAMILEFTMNDVDPPTIDPASVRRIIEWPSGGHNGCCIKFGPDGYLYFSTGDGAGPDPPDPLNTGQDLDDLLSCILRIDVDRTEKGRAYRIPKGNPFVGLAGARPEIWAYGFRNPWRMQFDDAGALWVGDVGWELWEMIYKVQPGGNYGWSVTEGPNPRIRTDLEPGPTPILPPTIAHAHHEAASITGGLVYMGSRLPGLRGAYVYGDYETGIFWAFREAPDRMHIQLLDSALRVVSFAEGPDRELVVLDYQGGMYQIVKRPVTEPSRPFPRQLSETGLFRSVKDEVPEAGVFPYSITAPMWQDGATARRWIGLPGSEPVRHGSPSRYPAHTVLAKTLSLELGSGSTGSTRRIETQVLHFDGQVWHAYTYRWNEEQTDASLVPASGAFRTFQVKASDAPGGSREYSWRFPGRAECLRCHNPWSGNALAFNLDQLGRGEADSEAERLIRTGVLAHEGSMKGPGVALVNPYDTSRALNNRARSWLHANCAHCHRQNAGGAVATVLNIELNPDQTRAVNRDPLRGSFGLAQAKVIAPGLPQRSALLYRVCSEGVGHMPLLGARTADPVGIALVRDWILEMPAAESEAADSRKARKDFVLRDLYLTPSAESKPEQQQAAIERYLDTTSDALILASHLREPYLKPIRPAVLGAVSLETNLVVRDLFGSMLPASLRRRVLGGQFDPDRVLSLSGSAERGRAVFRNESLSQCTQCHRAESVGNVFGPDLKGIGQRYRKPDLLKHLTEPSRFIAPEYLLHHVLQTDDLDWSGFLVSSNRDVVVLQTRLQPKLTIKREAVRTHQTSELSAMPEGLLDNMTPQEAADLLAYLKGL